jgi:hypothetical protein
LVQCRRFFKGVLAVKLALKIVAGLIALVVVVAGGFIAFLALKPPNRRPPSAEKIAATPARLARGEYLGHHVVDCMGCHSDHLYDRFCLPVKPGTAGQGGLPFGEKFGVPGVVCAQNITSDPEYGLGNWTDGEVVRAVREGIDRNGDTLFPMMPYEGYRSLSDEDIKAVVVYLRTLPPVHRPVPRKHIRFPFNLLIKSAPKPVDGPVPQPSDEADHLGYGRYLATIASCQGCHATQDSHHNPIPGMEFAGGFELVGPWGRVVAPNLTPEEHTWMRTTTRDAFIGRFKAFASFDESNAPKAPPGRNTVMPWLAFSGMTEQDLGAIYDFLKTVKPVRHAVNPFPDAPRS